MRPRLGERRRRRRFGPCEILTAKTKKWCPTKLTSAHRRCHEWPGLIACLVINLCLVIQPAASLAQQRATVIVSFTPGHPANRFRPSHVFGAGIDGHDKGVTDLQLSPTNVRAMLSAGLTSLTYRLRTELANDVWHWNPRGSWSDESSKQGYWTSDPRPDAPISLSY